MEDFDKKLEEYFRTTSKEQVLKDWEKTKHLDKIGPTVDEFINMETYPKFIIENFEEEGDCLILAKCTYHKQIVTNGDNVKGGGWFSISKDVERPVITLFGDSVDLGKTKIDDIAKCVQTNRVYRSPRLGIKFEVDEYSFMYRTDDRTLIDLKTYKYE